MHLFKLIIFNFSQGKLSHSLANFFPRSPSLKCVGWEGWKDVNIWKERLATDLCSKNHKLQLFSTAASIAAPLLPLAGPGLPELDPLPLLHHTANHLLQAILLHMFHCGFAFIQLQATLHCCACLCASSFCRTHVSYLRKEVVASLVKPTSGSACASEWGFGQEAC